jgi:hypothetical protein
MTRHRARTHWRLAALAFAAAALTGCAGGSDLPQWTLFEELRIGSVDDAATALLPVGDLAFRDDGTVFVAQPGDGTIRVFDAEGTPLRSFGGLGQAPGRFLRLYTVGFLADTLWAVDLTQRRISFFSPEGELLGTAPGIVRGVPAPFLPGPPFALFADGTGAAGTAIPQTAPPEALERVPQLRVDRAGSVIDTAAWISYEATARRADYEGRPLGVGSPLSDDRFAMFSPDGSRVVTIDRDVAESPGTSTFGVTVTDRSGDTVYAREYEYDPVPMRDAVIDNAVLPMLERVEQLFPSRADADRFLRESMFLPDFFTPVTTALFSTNATLWLKREDLPREEQRWLVVDQAGEPVAEVRVPEDVRVVAVRGDNVWGVATDEYGTPYVVRSRVVR